MSGRHRLAIPSHKKTSDGRSLSPFQKKIMRAFADDIEGKDPNVYFGSPPESTSTSTNGTASHPSPKPPSTFESPTAEPKPHKPHNPYEASNPQQGREEGFIGKVASALGGALGFVDRFLGRK